MELLQVQMPYGEEIISVITGTECNILVGEMRSRKDLQMELGYP